MYASGKILKLLAEQGITPPTFEECMEFFARDAGEMPFQLGQIEESINLLTASMSPSAE